MVFCLWKDLDVRFVALSKFDIIENSMSGKNILTVRFQNSLIKHVLYSNLP